MSCRVVHLVTTEAYQPNDLGSIPGKTKYSETRNRGSLESTSHSYHRLLPHPHPNQGHNISSNPDHYPHPEPYSCHNLYFIPHLDRICHFHHHPNRGYITSSSHNPYPSTRAVFSPTSSALHSLSKLKTHLCPLPNPNGRCIDLATLHWGSLFYLGYEALTTM